jgi:hypothetical protein
MIVKKKSFYSMSAVLALAAMSWAQDPAAANSPSQAPAAKAQNSSAGTPPSGTLLAVELSKSLDAKKIKANDRIEARTATDLLEHGQIVFPRNAKIFGHVTEAKAHSKESPDSTIGITFDRMVLKDGREVPLQLVVQAIARPLQFAAASDGNVPRADRPAAGAQNMPGQRGALGDASNQGAPSSYPGDLAPIPDPMSQNGSASATVVPLSPTSKGVVGMKGLSLDTSGPAAVLSSTTGNVHLDTGTQLILRVQ